MSYWVEVSKDGATDLVTSWNFDRRTRRTVSTANHIDLRALLQVRQILRRFVRFAHIPRRRTEGYSEYARPSVQHAADTVHPGDFEVE